MTRGLVRVLPSLVALAAAAFVSALVIALAGGNPAHAFAALLDGAFGSADSWSETLVKTCPLLLCGLAVALAFQTGIWNIGAEGQLLIGALLAAWAGTRLPLPGVVGIPLLLLCAAAGGAGWAAIAGALKLRREVNEVISTIMLNFIALGLIGYLVQGPLMEAGGRYPQTDAVLAALRLPRLLPSLRVHAGLPVALLAVGLLQVVLYHTVAGYEMRAAGLNPAAARLAGIAVAQRMFWAIVASGALAGLAGGIEVSAITYRLYERFSPGYGFTAIAVGLLGRLTPVGVLIAALLFGALEAGSNAMQREAGVSAVLVSIIQATVIFFLVAAEHGRWLPHQPMMPVEERE
ncbi:MAG TPA: ABC transporter permease [Candidatus Kryptonia bacterium]|nr:ABC transporter permease [Candidatus Kryptonia bacterium]